MPYEPTEDCPEDERLIIAIRRYINYSKHTDKKPIEMDGQVYESNTAVRIGTELGNIIFTAVQEDINTPDHMKQVILSLIIS